MGRKRSDLAAIRAQYPAISNLEWERAFREDNELYGRVWNDILKFDQAGEGRPGPRPALDKAVARLRYLQLTDDDFTFLVFHEALGHLARGMSIRKLSDFTGLDTTLIYRLLKGKKEPDAYEMEIIATAFGRRPSYFLEYRIGYVLAMVHAHMKKYPESSVGPFIKVRDKMKGRADAAPAS